MKGLRHEETPDTGWKEAETRSKGGKKGRKRKLG